ncbi:MAG: sn-glycerol-3-phosphate ABC transporter ATP-binding protein UgpC [Elusimicrobia bacterium]|nr:sn-glycerol-3-phosphate ABC transporter ATP-binding protein UgpC [Elusimicrobiota bacterium]
MSEVILSGVKKSFGDRSVIKGVDLEIRSGELLVMVGPSGCGKTTLLRLIAGLEAMEEGDIYIGGRKVNELVPRDRDISMVFQSYALYPHMSVRENMAFGLTLRRLPAGEIDERVAEAAELLGIAGLLERRPAALSGGQRQRVAMGRAIVRRPKLFLFDEPLSNLDAGLRVQMRGEIARLHRRLGATMIYVTHDQVEAMTLASRLAVFDSGRLLQSGPPLELYHRPANRFVAQFLGSPAMNMLEARLESGRLSGRGFSLTAPADLSAASGPVLVGLRPQDLHLADQGPIRGCIEAIERLGSDGYAFLSTEAGPVAARFDPDSPVSVGAQAQVAPWGDSLYVFSPDGQRALRHPGRDAVRQTAAQP